MFGDGRRHRKVRERIDKIVHGCSPSMIYEWHRVDDVCQKISSTFNNLAPEFKVLSVATGECTQLWQTKRRSQLSTRVWVPADGNRRNRYNIYLLTALLLYGQIIEISI
jgi:hypothetical protein